MAPRQTETTYFKEILLWLVQYWTDLSLPLLGVRT